MRTHIILIVFMLALYQVAFSQDKQIDTKTVNTFNRNHLIVYGSDSCHYCVDTKLFLKENNIAFKYFDVDVNLEKQNEMVVKLKKAGISLDAISLPIIDLYGKLIINDAADFDGFLKTITKKK